MAVKKMIVMKNGEKIIAVIVFILFSSFLGIPVPDWLASAVSALAGTIAAIITGFSNLISFVQIFIRF